MAEARGRRAATEVEGFTFDDQTVAEITRDFQSEEGEEIFNRPNVVGMGVGPKVTSGQATGQNCAKVLVSQKLPSELIASGDMVPPTVGGTATDVEEVGELLAGHDGIDSLEGQDPATLQDVATIEGQDAGALALKWRVRPVEGGYSVGHYRITAGTYATAVYDRSAYPGVPARYYVLSNNHVLANSNNARVGDPILQPGPYDGGTYPQDVIARLSRWVPIHFLPSTTRNYVDAAIAEGPFQFLDREIYWVGYVKGFRNNWPAINETLQKTGRTTNWTTGQVTAINATVNVGYGGGKVARFHGQIVTRRMGGPGDSGSLVLDLNENAIGLLFAGSSTHTIINHIVFVQNLLGIRLGHF
jgi:S1-C subfamily serine protease